jgi:anti-sigma regulatory factor (Ser/Thr protein kinase)
MQQARAETIEVGHESDVGKARRAARATAESLGFGPDACEEVALAAVELATNLVKHAQGGGTLSLTPLAEDARAGLQIESLDRGPGIVDIERAMTDGFSTAGSFGVGLGALNRLMDDFEIASSRSGGTRIVCRKWLRRHPVSVRRCPLAFGVATRPHPGLDVNGDAFVVKSWAESTLVGIIDGLGHGQFAHRAAQTARQYVESHYDLPMGQIFRGVHTACRATRGVVMALACFDWGQGRVSLASVGNIEVRVFPAPEAFHFIVRRGILGLNAPEAVVAEHPWPLDSVMVLHSDGLSTHWRWKDFPDLADKPASVAAQGLLRGLAKDQDDATAIVVRKIDA